MFKLIFLPWLFPIFGMFFAAGADALADVGSGDTGGDTGAADTGIGDTGYGADVPDDTPADDTAVIDRPEPAKPTEEPEVQEFKGSVSARLRGLVKQSPKLAEAFKENPKLQEQIEATFRREAALREVFPTVAEARQMREKFPNGLADVQQLEQDVKDVEELDNDFYTRDNEGNYPGHAKILDNMFRDDREAAVSLFKNLPKEWARLDRDSYNEVMGRIVGATIANAGISEFIGELLEQVGDNKGLKAGLQKLANWANGYLSEKPRPSAEEERLSRDKANFQRQQADRDKEDGQRFHNSFVAQSRKLQADIVKSHPAVKRLLENKAIPDQKKSDIVEQIRKNIESLLGKSPSFMRKLNPAYHSRNLEESMTLQKAAWSQQWLLNRMVRTVMGKEIPQMVSNNREAVRRRAGAPIAKPPVTTGDKASKGPKQIGGRWYRDGGNGAPFTTAEVLAGKHLQA